MSKEELLKEIDNKFHSICCDRDCADCPYNHYLDCRDAHTLDYLIENGYLPSGLFK